jgi:excisionase family DNA binding protein
MSETATREIISVEFPPILTVEQASKLLQLDRHTIYELIRQKKIPGFKAGRAIRLNRDKLLEIVASGELAG